MLPDRALSAPLSSHLWGVAPLAERRTVLTQLALITGDNGQIEFAIRRIPAAE